MAQGRGDPHTNPVGTGQELSDMTAAFQSLLDRVNTIYGGVDQFPGAYSGRTTESGHEEAAQFAQSMVPLNHKTLYDNTLFNLTYSQQQMLRHTEDLHQAHMQVVQNTINNQNNQFQNNNAACTRASDLLLNLDVREGAAIASVLDLTRGMSVEALAVIAEMVKAIKVEQ